MDGTTLSHTEHTQTLMLQCPICASDAADTLGVTGNVDGSLDATVVMRCEECSAVYLSPVPVEHVRSPPRLPASVLTRPRIERWTRDLAPTAKILCVDCAAGEYLTLLSQLGDHGWVIEGTDLEHLPSEVNTTGYDLILLPRSLESANDPNALLGQVADLLTAGGRVVAIVSNAGSSCFAAFGGRHWSGYQFPNTRQHLTPNALRRLGKNVGLRVRDLDAVFVSDAWLTSTANWLRDWGANNGVIRLFTGRWLVPQVMSSILEGIAAMRGRGSLLVAQLERQ